MKTFFTWFCIILLSAVWVQAGYWFQLIPEIGDTPVATWLDENVVMELRDGKAFVWIAGHDLSTYAGADGTSTPYRIVIEDANGDTVTGFLGSEGTGYAVGSELIANSSFATNETGWVNFSTAMVWSASYSGSAQQTGTSVSTVYHAVGCGVGECIGSARVYSYTLEACTTTGIKPYVDKTSIGYNFSCTADSPIYFTGRQEYPRDGFITASATGVYVGEVSDKYITEGPADYSLHVVSANGGSTRNWTTWDIDNFEESQTGMLFNIRIYEN